jgi:hypothetical protein
MRWVVPASAAAAVLMMDRHIRIYVAFTPRLAPVPKTVTTSMSTTTPSSSATPEVGIKIGGAAITQCCRPRRYRSIVGDIITLLVRID